MYALCDTDKTWVPNTKSTLLSQASLYKLFFAFKVITAFRLHIHNGRGSGAGAGINQINATNCKLSILAIDEREFGRNISEGQVSRITSSLDRVSQASELTPPSSQTNLGIRLDRFYLFFFHTPTFNPLYWH